MESPLQRLSTRLLISILECFLGLHFKWFIISVPHQQFPIISHHHHHLLWRNNSKCAVKSALPRLSYRSCKYILQSFSCWMFSSCFILEHSLEYPVRFHPPDVSRWFPSSTQVVRHIWCTFFYYIEIITLPLPCNAKLIFVYFSGLHSRENCVVCLAFVRVCSKCRRR